MFTPSQSLAVLVLAYGLKLIYQPYQLYISHNYISKKVKNMSSKQKTFYILNKMNYNIHRR